MLIKTCPMTSMGSSAMITGNAFPCIVPSSRQATARQEPKVHSLECDCKSSGLECVKKLINEVLKATNNTNCLGNTTTPEAHSTKQHRPGCSPEVNIPTPSLPGISVKETTSLSSRLAKPLFGPKRLFAKSPSSPVPETQAEAVARHEARVRAIKNANPDLFYIYETFSEALEYFDGIAAPVPVSKKAAPETASKMTSDNKTETCPKWSNGFSRWGHLRRLSSCDSRKRVETLAKRPTSIDLRDLSLALRVYEDNEKAGLEARETDGLASESSRSPGSSALGEHSSVSSVGSIGDHTRGEEDDDEHVQGVVSPLGTKRSDSKVGSDFDRDLIMERADEDWGWGERRQEVCSIRLFC